MKQKILPILLGIFLLPNLAFADVWVNGYYRSDGTYVSGHYRSNPDGNPYNNWSYPGNTNPYTGVTAGGSRSTYLNNYYDTSSYGSYYNSYYDSYSPSYTSYSSYDYLYGDYDYDYYSDYTSLYDYYYSY